MFEIAHHQNEAKIFLARIADAYKVKSFANDKYASISTRELRWGQAEHF